MTDEIETDTRESRYAEAIWGATTGDEPYQTVMDRVLAVADEELAESRAEVAGMEARLDAVRLTRDYFGEQAVANGERAEAAEAETRALRERLTALADEPEKYRAALAHVVALIDDLSGELAAWRVEGVGAIPQTNLGDAWLALERKVENLTFFVGAVPSLARASLATFEAAHWADLSREVLAFAASPAVDVVRGTHAAPRPLRPPPPHAPRSCG